MKKSILTSILALLVTIGTTTLAQERPEEYLGLPGDNFNLYAVMNLFQESETLEDFERSLNDQNTRINNLDLNGDNLVDYVMVRDYVDGDVHTIVLQVALNRNEKQDVAVFTVQRFRNGSVQIQLIGDEALYGRNYIIEPIYDENIGQTPNPGYTRRSGNTIVRTTTYQIAAWPVIRFIYRPNYVVWHSSWDWGYYPSYWSPWSPYYYHYYYGYHYNYYPVYYRYYRHWHQPRYTRYNDFYYNRHRSYSTQVNININKGVYKTTYSRPEQRRDGEALYSKTRTSANTTQGRRTVSQSTREKNSVNTNSGNNRRSTNTNRTQSVSNPSANQSTGTTRRSNTVVNERTRENTSAGRSQGTAARTSSTVNNREGTSSPSGRSTTVGSSNRSSAQNAGTSTRQSTTVNNRSSKSVSPAKSTNTPRSQATVNKPVSRTQQENRAATSRTTRQSTASPGTTRRSQPTKPATAVKQTENSKNSETSSSRRK